jgi:sugar lactone lactonase YvrE
MRFVIQSLAVVSMLAVSSNVLAQGRLVGITGTGVYEISMTDGSVHQISTLAAGSGTIGGLAYDPSNNILYMVSSQNQNLMTLNPDTGSWSVIGSYGLGSNPIMQGLEFNPDTGHLYGHSAGSSHGFFLYDINVTTGNATNVGQSAFTSFHNLGYDSINHVMYMTNSNTENLYTLNLTNNVATVVGPLVNSTNPNGLAFNHDTGVMYMIDNSQDNLYTLDLQTGLATVVGSVGSSNFLSLVYIPIPAPGGILAFGLAIIGMSRRRR